MKPSDSPITVEEWQDGIDPGLFVKWLYPEDFQEVLENFVPLLVIPEGPENSRKRVRFWVATKRIREKLNDDLKREYELKYLPLDDPAAKWKSVPPHRYPEIVKQVSYRLSGIPKTFNPTSATRHRFRLI